MKEVWPSMVFAFPVGIYAGASVLAAVPASQSAFSGMFVAMLILAVLSAFPYESIQRWTAVTELVAAVLIVGALYFALDFGVQLLAGSLLAVPALLVGYSVRPGPLGWRLFAFGLALTVGLGLLAAAQGIVTAGAVLSAGAFIHEFFSLLGAQAMGLYGVLTATGGTLPLRDFFDPDFVLLSSLAAAALLFTSLRPQSAWGELLPAAGTMPSPLPNEYAPEEIGPEAANALAGRSLPEPAASLPPGVPGLVGGCLAAVIAVVAAFAVPGIALLLIAVGVVAALAFSIAVMRRTLPHQP